MSDNRTIQVQKREDEGKGASRRLRREGFVPAIVYGGDLPPVSIQLAHNHVWHASQNEWFYSAILDLSLNGNVQKVLLRDIQRHPFKQQVLHLDFQRVSADEALRVRVPLHFEGQDESPAGKTRGVVIMHEQTDVEIVCLPRDLPEAIVVDLSRLEEGGTVHMSELVLPEGVEIPELALGTDHDQVIAVARMMYVEPEPEAESGEEGEGGEAAEQGED